MIRRPERTRSAEQVRLALSAYDPVPNTMMRVRAQGSKLNNTDTSDESDVDIRVEYFTDGGQDPDIARIFFTKRAGLAKSLTREQLGLIDAPLPLNQETFKTHIERALVERFGSANVHRNDKCIKS